VDVINGRPFIKMAGSIDYMYERNINTIRHQTVLQNLRFYLHLLSYSFKDDIPLKFKIVSETDDLIIQRLAVQ